MPAKWADLIKQTNLSQIKNDRRAFLSIPALALSTRVGCWAVHCGARGMSVIESLAVDPDGGTVEAAARRIQVARDGFRCVERCTGCSERRPF